MSARPRPVTATFPPPAVIEYRQHSARSCSVSTGSSTASLLSVLDHDSCNEDAEYPARRGSSRDCSADSRLGHDEPSRESSPIPRPKSKSSSVDSDAVRRPLSDNGNVVMNDKRINVERRFQSAKVSSRPRPTSSPSRGEEIDENNESGSENKHLTAWEQWVLRKAKEDRDRLELELEKQRREHEKAERERQEKESKKAKAAEVIQAWIEEHDSVVKQRLQLDAQRRRAEKELKETKKKDTETKAEERYKEWLEKKAAEDAETKRLEKQRKEKEALDKKMKEEVCKKAVDEWMVKARGRSRTAPNSFGYSAGKLRGYYDTSAYPAPSYVNPIPWRPIEIPVPPKPVAKKKAPKPRWNPAKYL